MQKYITKILAGLIIMILANTVSAKIIEKIVVKVNDEIITMYDIYLKTRAIRTQYIRSRKRVPRNLRKHALDQLIGEKLISQIAKKKGVIVSKNEVDDRMKKIIKRRKMTEKQFIAQLKKEKLSMAKFRAQMKLMLSRQKLFRKSKKFANLKPNDKEIMKFYNKLKPKQFHVMHLYIRLNPHASFTVRARVENRIGKVRKMLKANKWNFAYIMRFADIKKDYGFILPKREMPKYLFPVFSGRMYAGKMKEFRVVNEIPGYAGFHAVFVRATRLVPIAKIRSRIANMLYEKKLAGAVDAWVKTLRKDAVITYK